MYTIFTLFYFLFFIFYIITHSITQVVVFHAVFVRGLIACYNKHPPFSLNLNRIRFLKNWYASIHWILYVSMFSETFKRVFAFDRTTEGNVLFLEDQNYSQDVVVIIDFHISWYRRSQKGVGPCVFPFFHPFPFLQIASKRWDCTLCWNFLMDRHFRQNLESKFCGSTLPTSLSGFDVRVRFDCNGGLKLII